MAISKKSENVEITILEISQGSVDVAIIGTKPIYFNRMAEKAKRELLLPKGRKTAADRAQSLKHDPVSEFRNSVYRNYGDSCATRLCFPTPAFKGAMMTAALDLPGTKKTEIGRLAWVENYSVDLYGIPMLKMDVVRSADMNRTPDIRTRAIVTEWCCLMSVSFTQPKLSARSVLNLIAAGGITCGVGDFRQEKGKGSFGQYRLAEANDKDLKRIMKLGREVQDEALENYKCFDGETEELFDWYLVEVANRTVSKSKPEAEVDAEEDGVETES
jgi:hypothetical protein